MKVVIGVPNKDAVEPAAYDNHLELMFSLGRLQERSAAENVRFQFFLTTIPRVFPALARESIAEHAVKSVGADYLFMWDDDMIVPPDLFERLYARNVDIVAPLAFTRLPPHKPVIYNVTEGWDALDRRHYYINHSVMNYPRNSFFQCDAVGFGSVLIKTTVLAKMQQPWFMTTSGAGEDIHFCIMAGKSGFKTYADTTVKLGHLGEPGLVTEETFDAQPEAAKLKETHGEERKYKTA